VANQIDDRTSIPLFAALAATPIIIGFIVWLSTIYSMASNAEFVNIQQDDKIINNGKILIDIRERLIRIETKISDRMERDD